MAITIGGIRIDNIEIIQGQEGKREVKGNYSLMSSKNTALAKQGFNGYDNLVVGISADTTAAVNSFMKSIEADIKTILNLDEEE